MSQPRFDPMTGQPLPQQGAYPPQQPPGYQPQQQAPGYPQQQPGYGAPQQGYAAPPQPGYAPQPQHQQHIQTTTTVVHGGAPVVVGTAKTPWVKGLFSCFDDFGVCLYAWCCPHCAAASARTAFDESNWCFNCLCLNPAVLRSIVREGYNIEGGCCGDMMTSAFCGPCVICQVQNEVNERGPVSTTRGPPDVFRNSLFGCFKDTSVFLYGWCFPQCAIAQARAEFDGSDCCFNCCCVSPSMTRNIIREGYNLQGDCCTDILIAAFCGHCMACQLLNEVRERGNVNNQVVSGGPTVVTTTQTTNTQQPGFQKMA